jgi:hypothetical protein
MNLYRDWSRKLHETGRYSEAFRVLADAAYRYPGELDFTKNLRTSFILAMKAFWDLKDWQGSRDLAYRYLDSDALNPQGDAVLAGLFKEWSAFLKSRGLQLEAGQSEELARDFENPIQ